MLETIKLYILIFFIYGIAGWVMESTMISIKNKTDNSRPQSIAYVTMNLPVLSNFITILLHWHKLKSS